MVGCTTLWDEAPADLTLLSDEVHVWRATLDQPVSQLPRLASTLAPEERARADRFHFERDRRQFIAGRGFLRFILGRYLRMEPNCLEFSYGPHGKPALLKPPARDILRFNVAHSHGLALYAVTRGREIGVDVEYLRPMDHTEQIAERFFSPDESATLRALPPAAKLEAFFTCWTRKEAYIKARGEGLSLPLDQFSVSLIPGQPARLVHVRGAPQDVSQWQIHALDIGLSYVAALAVEGSGCRLHCWQWPVDTR